MGHEPALVLAYARPAEWWRGGVGLAYDAGAGPSGNVLVHGGRGRHRRGGQKRGGTGVGRPRGCWLWPSGPRWPRSQGRWRRGRPRSGSGLSWSIWLPAWSGPSWRSLRFWSGSPGGGWSSPSASAMVAGWWPGGWSPGWWWTPPPSSLTPGPGRAGGRGGGGGG